METLIKLGCGEKGCGKSRRGRKGEPQAL